MKILFLNEYAPPHSVSGAEHSMMALAKAIKKPHQVYILSPNLGGKKQNLKFSFILKTKPGKTLSPLWFNNPVFCLYAAYHIVKTIKHYHINLIHVHGKYIQPAAIIAKWLTKTPVITTVRDFKFLCPLALCYTHQKKHCSFKYFIQSEIPEYQQRYTSGFRPLLSLRLSLAKLWQYRLKWFLSQSDQIIAVSPQLAKIYQQAGLKKTISIYNPPPQPAKTKTAKPKQSTILSVGKLSYGKGTDSLLKAAQKLPQIKFILAGPKNISLKTEFPDNCQYLGQLDHHQVLKLYRRASAFIILSRWPEPLSRAGLEALSFGLPIIASDRGGNQELVKNNGFLVDPDKPDQVAKVINQVLKQPQLGQASLKLLKTRFNRQKIIQAHIKLYKELT